jgi:translation initiation factor 4A
MTDNNESEQTKTTKRQLVSAENWDDLTDIKQEVLRGIYGYGFEKPSPIQQKAIQPMVDGFDIIAQAQSGTGKTGVFAVGALNKVDTTINTTQIIILSPTRELSKQTKDVLSSLGEFIKGLRIQLLIGGTSTDADIDILKNDTPHIVVGCPGRTHDMMRRQHINNKRVKLVILDEADEMLSSGFKEQIYNIFQFLPKDVQLCLFSATMPPELSTLTEKFMRDPIQILVKSEMLTLEGISQYYVGMDDDQSKYLTLKDLFSSISLSQCIIYCNSVKRVRDLHLAMVEDNFPVSCIHSEMTKDERDTSYHDFKSGASRVLISTNITARGIDIQQVSTVINFDIPKCVHIYLHRIGRSGRWGRKGIGINFVTKRDLTLLKNIESHYSTQIEELPLNFATM